jgi:hypothetical protein
MTEDCPSLEKRVAELTKQQAVDVALIKAMDDFATLHGGYSLNELRLFDAYGNLSHSIKENEKVLAGMLKQQETKKH